MLDKKSGVMVSALGLGCMGMSEWYGVTDDNESTNTIRAAFEMGINFFDTADMYGKGHNETLLGRAVAAFRDKVIIATKCGITRDLDGPNTIGVNGSYSYIKQACDASLKRLNTDHIDLFYLHRIDAQVPIEESMRAMKELVDSGKIRFIGLCEVDSETLARAHKIAPVTAVQTEYSIGTREAAEAILPVCKKLGISFVPYSPMGRGLFSGKYRDASAFEKDDFRTILPQFEQENLAANLRFIDVLQTMAREKGYTAAQLALAWVLAQGDNIIPIPGTRRIKHLQENIVAADIVLSSNDLQRIEQACQESPVQGKRLPPALMQAFNLKF